MNTADLEQMIELLRKMRMYSARMKIASKVRKVDHQARQRRVAYTNAKIKLRQQVANQIKAKRK